MFEETCIVTELYKINVGALLRMIYFAAITFCGFRMSN